MINMLESAEKVTFTNAIGKTITLGSSFPYILEFFNGKGDVASDTQVQYSPFQDGSNYIDSKLENRNITLEIAIIGETRDHLNMLRQNIASAFNPKMGLGKLVYSNGETERMLYVVADGLPQFPTGDAYGQWWQKCTINLVAPQPYWEDISVYNYKLADFVGNFRFPFRFPVRFSTRGDSTVVFNHGDVPTPIKVLFQGDVSNPRITNDTTKEYIQVNRDIPKGFSLVITTGQGDKSAEIIDPNGVVENAFHYIDLNSDFFDLDIGENKLSFLATGGSPEVYIEYKNRYVSV